MSTIYTDTGEPFTHDMESRIREELAPDERVLWRGRPLPQLSVRQGLPIVLFGTFFTAFSVYWMLGAIRQGGDVAFVLFGLPFVLVGLGMLSVPFWLRRSAYGTCYVLTERRAIVWRAGWAGGMYVRSYRPEDLRSLSRRERSDGSGDVIFEEFRNEAHGYQMQPPGFIAIDGVRDVEALIRRTLLSGQYKAVI